MGDNNFSNTSGATSEATVVGHDEEINSINEKIYALDDKPPYTTFGHSSNAASKNTVSQNQ